MGNLQEALKENQKNEKPKVVNNLEKALNENKAFNNTQDIGGRAGVSSPTNLNSKYDTEIGSGHNLFDIQENRAQQQGVLDKWGNGIVKATGIAGTSALESTAGLLYGLGSAVNNKDASKLYDNDFTRSLDEFNDYLSKAMPNYHTKAEEDYNLLQKLGTANFWSESALSGAGYMAGAIATGYGLGKFASIAKLARSGKAINEAALLSGSFSKLNNSAKLVRIADAVDFGKNAVLMSAGESGIEARQILDGTKRDLIQQYKDLHNGQEPDGDILKYIDQQAKSAGNFGYAANLAITGTTNALLFPKLLSQGYGANKMKLNNISFDGAKYIAENESLLKGVSKEGIKGSLEEGGQELSQLLTQKVLTD